MSEEIDRLDLWLKHVCLFRTRTEASTAVKGGHVKLNGARVKASATIRPGDVVEITRPDRTQRIEAISVPARQASRKEARDHYNDVTPEQRKPPLGWGEEPQRAVRGKLNKKDRRDLRRLKGK